MGSKEKAMYHLGPNQRQILGLLRVEPNLTLEEIAGRLYDESVKVGSYKYVATSRSVSLLVKKGLVARQEAAVTFSLPNKPKRRKTDAESRS